MADYISALADTTTVENKQIVEPLNAPTPLIEKIRSFFPEETYNISDKSILFKFLSALLGDAGVGGMKKGLLYPKLQKALTSTHFNDLDTLFTDPFSFPRLTDEIYTADPSNEMLTADEWAVVRRKDSQYKSRFWDYMQGVQKGVTNEGTKLIAKSATGAPALVYERWKYLDDIVSDNPVGFPNIGNTNSRNEVVVVAQNDDYTPKDERRLYQAFNKLAPSNLLFTFDSTSSNLVDIPVNNIYSSSDFFFTKRLVTGNAFNTYPDVSSEFNTWIESGVQKEAPTTAFSINQESVTYPTIESAEASSYHIGPFSETQQALFAHLSDIPNDLYQFDANQSFTDVPVNLDLTLPWYSRTNSNTNQTVNNYYPVGYFANTSIGSNSKKLFWASNEETPGVSEYLILDLQNQRPVDMIEFQICMKPIDIGVQYLDDNGDWQDVVLRTDVENHTQVFYATSSTYSWQNVEISFEDVVTNKIKLNFDRRPDSFPLNASPLFDWSIEIKELRLGYLMTDIASFISDQGVDILGNAFETILETYGVDRLRDNNVDTFWQSQANPSPTAVETLYFDISTQGSASTIDQVWIDPVTPGPLTHVYYSNDDSTLPTIGDYGQGNVLFFDAFDYPDGTILTGTGLWYEKRAWGNPTANLVISNKTVVASTSTLDCNAVTTNKYGDGDYIFTLSTVGFDNYFYLNIAFDQTDFDIPNSLSDGHISTVGFTAYPKDGFGNFYIQMYKDAYGSYPFVQNVDVPGKVKAGDQFGMRKNGNTYLFIYKSVDSGQWVVLYNFFDNAPLSQGRALYGTKSAQTAISDFTITSLYSQTEDDWDSKLWSPIPRHYVLQRGNIIFPNPIVAKYIKLEFTNFDPVPYNNLYKNNMKPIRYRTFPTWVVEYITSINNNNNVLQKIVNNEVQNTPEILGVIQPDVTKLDDEKRKSIVDFQNDNQTSTALSNYKSWEPGKSTDSNSSVNNTSPQIYPNDLFQQSLLDTANSYLTVQGRKIVALNPTSAQSFTQERNIQSRPLIPLVSKQDRTQVEIEKTLPEMWFPRVCRHGYKVLEVKREFNVAYYVAIREIKFYKRNQTSQFDDDVYFETLADTSNVASNTFVPGDWRYVVDPSVVQLAGSNNIPTFGWEDFDGVTFL